jgi:signal transduction histidine kinase
MFGRTAQVLISFITSILLIFDKLDQNTEGVGVGLTIVKQIVEMRSG